MASITHGRAVVSRRIGRSRLVETVVQLAPAVIAMEACCGAHHWGRRFRDLGIEVRLIHARFVRPYVKSAKNDARDAEAICEAAQVASGSRAGDALAHGVDQPHPRSAAGVRHRLAARADAVPTGGNHLPSMTRRPS
jgi:transposase